MAMNINKIETVDTMNTAVVDVKHTGVFNKKSTVSVAGHDIVTMPRNTAAAMGNGLMTGVGMAVAAAGISVVGSVCCYAGQTIVTKAASVIPKGKGGKKKTKLPHFPKHDSDNDGRKYQEGGND